MNCRLGSSVPCQEIENVLQKEVILFHRANRQNRNNSVLRDLGGVIHYNILPTRFSSSPEPKKNARMVAAMRRGSVRFSDPVRPETNPLRAIRWDNPSPANTNKPAGQYSHGRD